MMADNKISPPAPSDLETEGKEVGPIEVFRAGSFTDIGGKKQTIKNQDLEEIASLYDPEEHPAPVVIGHPETDAPAYGWVSKLYVENGVLKAMLRDVVPQFYQSVKEGRYKRVSISLFLPTSTANPVEGKLYLRHLGFLGAAAPAVPNLKPVKFAQGGETSFAMSQEFAPNLTAQMKELADLRRESIARRVDDLIKEGRVLPTLKEEVISFAAYLESSDAVSFADGTTKPSRDWFFSFLEKQPKVVSFGEFKFNDAYPLNSGATSAIGCAVPDGFSADPRAVQEAARIAKVARENGISFSDAIDFQGKV